MNPHDHVYVDGKVERLEGDLLHYSYPTLSDHRRTIQSFTTIAAREKHARGERTGLLTLLARPAWKFLRMFVLKAGFLDGPQGLVVAGMGAFYVFLKWFKLWELQTGASSAPAATDARS